MGDIFPEEKKKPMNDQLSAYDNSHMSLMLKSTVGPSLRES